MIKLSKEEQDKIKDYAIRFAEHKKGKDRKQGNGDGLKYNIMGFTGEYIVHKRFGKEFRWDFDKKKRFDDIVLEWAGRKIVCDIKSSFTGDELRVARWHIDNPDFGENVDAYILVKVSKELDSGEVVGIISKRRFKEIAELKMYNTACYCVSSSELSSVDLLSA